MWTSSECSSCCFISAVTNEKASCRRRLKDASSDKFASRFRISLIVLTKGVSSTAPGVYDEENANFDRVLNPASFKALRMSPFNPAEVALSLKTASLSAKEDIYLEAAEDAVIGRWDGGVDIEKLPADASFSRHNISRIIHLSDGELQGSLFVEERQACRILHLSPDLKT